MLLHVKTNTYLSFYSISALGHLVMADSKGKSLFLGLKDCNKRF